MRTRLILTASVLGLAALLSGCATTAATSPTNSPDATTAPTENPEETTTPEADFTAGWLASGTMIGVVTTGSSTCVPIVESVEGSGDTVTVTLADPEPSTPCTRDLQPRITGVGLPEGVDATKLLVLDVTYNDITASIDLAASTAPATDPLEMAPSAGYAGPNTIGLVTYGSSTCVPTVESAEPGDDASNLVVTFATADANKPCTMDMAPRVTVVHADSGVKTLTVVDAGTETAVDVLANGF